jgi:hypothetical protein
MVDPHIRLQNIALEHAELIARRSMSWSESTNRTTMFLTVVGAAVVGLALFAQASGPDGGLALLALLILSVVLLIGLTTFARLTQLDDEDMRLVQGLNRLRHMRLELDPSLQPYLVTSRHDDFQSVLRAYGPADASFVSGFATLAVLVLIVNCVLVAVVGGLIAVQLGADATLSVLTGVVGAIGFAVAVGLWFLRAIRDLAARFVSLVPASPERLSPSSAAAPVQASTGSERAAADDTVVSGDARGSSTD